MSTEVSRPADEFEYLSEDTILSGLASATIGVTPEVLSHRSGVEWGSQDTELGPSAFAVVRLFPDGPRFTLRSYEMAPFPGVIVSADATATERDIEMLLASLGVEGGEIIDRVPVRSADEQESSSRDASTRRSGLQVREQRRPGPKRSPRVRRVPRGGPLYKAALIEAISVQSGLTKADSQRAVDSLVGTVSRALRKGEEVDIRGFGKFSVVHQSARQGVNPRTGARIKIKARKTPKFTPGGELRQAVSVKED